MVYMRGRCLLERTRHLNNSSNNIFRHLQLWIYYNFNSKKEWELPFLVKEICGQSVSYFFHVLCTWSFVSCPKPLFFRANRRIFLIVNHGIHDILCMTFHGSFYILIFRSSNFAGWRELTGSERSKLLRKWYFTFVLFCYAHML